jgi:hypothetical protein
VLALALAAAVLLPQTAAAGLNINCSEKCTASSDCSTPCRLYGSGPLHPDDVWGTCGDYGVCDYPDPGCTPNWVAVSESTLGVYDLQDYFNPPACEVREVVEVTFTDTNGCGDPDWTGCYERQIGYEPSGFCCGVYWACFGPRGCAAAGY